MYVYYRESNQLVSDDFILTHYLPMVTTARPFKSDNNSPWPKLEDLVAIFQFKIGSNLSGVRLGPFWSLLISKFGLFRLSSDSFC